MFIDGAIYALEFFACDDVRDHAALDLPKALVICLLERLEGCHEVFECACDF